ncbi:MAG: hypothetical protein II073_09570 [Lachnospiraceae bacterium]|nr:hypothetical protein [Lachnospiraceae bacterium]
MFQKGEQHDITCLIENMLEGYNATRKSMQEIDKIAEESKMLAISAARELGRMEAAGGFQIITQKIKVFAADNYNTNQQNKENVNRLNEQISNMVGVRTADVAADLIEEIERNLFERYCNVQAWASMADSVQFATHPTDVQYQEKATNLIEKMCSTYKVYHDILLLDKAGKVLTCAKKKDLIGSSMEDATWYQKDSDINTYVSDLYYDTTWENYTVVFCSKIFAEDGSVIGTVATVFDWQYILDMIDHTKIGKKGEIYLINKQGQVIGARDRELIFHKNMLLECQGAQTILAGDLEQEYGYALEKNDNQELTRVLGYAKTSGYEYYQGKEWAVLALENIRV